MTEVIWAGWRGKIRMDLGDAIKNECAETAASGIVECASDEARNAAKMLARLIERLVNKRILSVDDVITHVLSDPYEEVTGEGGS